MASQTPPSGTFAGRYTIERELGRGGTAVVYLANDTTTSTSVALKVLHRELVESVAADRFLREFRMNAGLRHPHIAPILNSGQFGADLFLVMPHMESGSLRTRLDKERQLSVESVVDVVRAIGSALQHAHERGLIHRDVKPENILFSDKEAYLSDFGIARAVERVAGDSTTSSGIVRGTPAYMSPEQASGDHHFDGRSDQYSFACVVYEMLAGMPAFHGPTQESTIALRFRVPPREISAYRPGVSQAIERVIQKAMSLSPADRYPNMTEFVKAFDAAVAAPAGRDSAGPRWNRQRQMVSIVTAILLVVVLSFFGVTRWLGHIGVPTDSTVVAVLPLEVSGGTTNGAAAYELFHTELRRWVDLHVVPLDRTIDALSRRGPGRLSPDEMRSIAISLGARRFVVVRPVRNPTGNAVFAEYHDVQSGSLKEAELELPRDSTRVASTYAALGDSIVLRGANDGGTPGGTGPRRLFATQAFIRAINARQEWDLTRADSELALAVSLDPTFSRAYLWQAQQKSWQGLDAQRWGVIAERALTDTMPMTPVERLMVKGLVAMGRTQYPEACSAYNALIRGDSMNFAGWYGLGDCNFNDHAAIRGASPSGWRLRGSLERAVTSYVHAFQIIPATYRGFQQSGYKRLRELLFISGNHLTPGTASGGPPQGFLAVPARSGDSLVFVAWPRNEVLSQRVSSISPPDVVLRLRASFDTVVTRWANAFPRSAEAKEALAISLELRGEPASLDTIRAAERLTTDQTSRIRLAANRLAVQLKFANDSADLGRTLLAADSLLGANKVPATPEIAGLLAPISAMIGKCAQTANLLSQSTSGPVIEGFPRDILAKIEDLSAAVAVGCTPSDVWRRLDEINNSVAKLQETETAKQNHFAELNAIVRAVLPSDSVWVTRLAAKGGRLIAAERDFVEGRPESARARLRETARAHQSALAGQVTADAVVPDARLWLALGDTAEAITSLETALNSVRRGTPLLTDEARYNTARMGYLIQAYALHAELLANRNRSRARQSAQIAVTMWRGADPALQPTVAQLREILH